VQGSAVVGRTVFPILTALVSAGSCPPTTLPKPSKPSGWSSNYYDRDRALADLGLER
jgi:hypothetical protein